MQPNILAYGMLAIWPLISIVLFNKLPLGRALIASLVAAYLFLPPAPAGFDLPFLPALTKETIPSLVAFAVCLVRGGQGMRVLPVSPLARGLVAVFVASPLATVLTNMDPVFFGQLGLPALRLREAVGMMAGQAILIAPLLLARAILADARDHRDLLLALVIGGLAYAPLMLIEVRLSPQLNTWIYGYFQHLFDQMMRGDGFRPIVFLYHGLWVAFFTMTAVLAATALARGGGGRRMPMALAALGLLVVLVLCKSLGSLLYAIALVPVVLLFGARAQIRLAALLAVLALAYPLAKGAHLVPDDQILALAGGIEQQRADSLRFRFDQEAILLDRAYERPLFGWGIWGRHHIHDPRSGEILTVTDGRWVLVIGTLGWVGFLAEFGLLALPLLMLWWRGTRAALSPWVGPTALILGVNIIDLVPNATITPLTWLFAGAILGHAERLGQREKNATLPRVNASLPSPLPEPIRTVL